MGGLFAERIYLIRINQFFVVALADGKTVDSLGGYRHSIEVGLGLIAKLSHVNSPREVLIVYAA